MKIAVYTIFKNEADFARRWLHSTIGADYVFAIDTGSTDGGAFILRDEAARLDIPLTVLDCNVAPWRFDDARNFSLNALPADADLCICLDMDEVLAAGWREKLEAAFAAAPDTTRFRYDYIWSWNTDGSRGLTYYADKIHARAGYQWRGPVHEVLERDRRLSPEVQTWIEATLILHYPDAKKPRSQYFPLLALEVAERPFDDRAAHYYGRELYFQGEYKKAIEELSRHLGLQSATWRSERAASCRYIGDSNWALGDYDLAIGWFLKANEEEPSRENYIRLAQAYRARGQWVECLEACDRAIEFKTRSNVYLNDPAAWSGWADEMRLEALKNLAPGKGQVKAGVLSESGD